MEGPNQTPESEQRPERHRRERALLFALGFFLWSIIPAVQWVSLTRERAVAEQRERELQRVIEELQAYMEKVNELDRERERVRWYAELLGIDPEAGEEAP